MIESYPITQDSPNSYIFFNKNNVEYQIVIKPSGITYENENGEKKDILNFALNCDTNIANKDYNTAKTIAHFCSQFSEKDEALFLQTHNQPEVLENDKIQRRGMTRIKLWGRLISKYFNDYILLTNLVLSPNKHSDIFCLVVKKDSAHFKQIVTNFYRFCYYRMYKKKEK